MLITSLSRGDSSPKLERKTVAVCALLGAVSNFCLSESHRPVLVPFSRLTPSILMRTRPGRKGTGEKRATLMVDDLVAGEEPFLVVVGRGRNNEVENDLVPANRRRGPLENVDAQVGQNVGNEERDQRWVYGGRRAPLRGEPDSRGHG